MRDDFPVGESWNDVQIFRGRSDEIVYLSHIYDFPNFAILGEHAFARMLFWSRFRRGSAITV